MGKAKLYDYIKNLKVYYDIFFVSGPYLAPYFYIFLYNIILKLLIHNPPLLETNFIKGTEILEENYKSINKELSRILKNKKKIPSFQEVDEGQKRISIDKKWKTFFLKIYGNYIEKNCKLCPKTVKLLEQVPGVYTAMFSILEPKKHIPGHHGLFKGVLRYHLGLIIPKNKRCKIQVGKKTYYWKEGKGILFDDTYYHEVWNNSNEIRVVLFLDIERPFKYRWLQKNKQKINEAFRGGRKSPKHG